MADDCDDRDGSKRKTRNLSEKKRRDQFTSLVSQLGNLITNDIGKLDKASVLKSTISFLKKHNEVTLRSRAHDVKEDWKPDFLSNEEFTYLVLEALEAFVMVFSPSGRIHYVSDSVSSLLGHNAADIVNKNMFDLTLEEDRICLYNLLQKNAGSGASDHMRSSSKEFEMTRFQIHVRRGTQDCRDNSSYDLIQFYGHFRSHRDRVNDNRNLMNLHRRVESGTVFVCIGRLLTPHLIRDMTLGDLSHSEFTSRHSLEWKFLFLDHRAPPIIGYLPIDVLGTSGYDYYHFDDLEKVANCHEALIEKGEITSSHYRFLTKGQQWIWLQTRYYITYHQWNSKPEFVVCTHRVVSYDDVVKTKEESFEMGENKEAEVTLAHLENNTDSDKLLPPISPSYITKSMTEAYETPYQPISQRASWGPVNVNLFNVSPTNMAISPSIRSWSNYSSSNVSPTNMSPMSPDLELPPSFSRELDQPSSPSFTSVTVTDDSGNTFQLVSQNTLMMSPNQLSVSPLTVSGPKHSHANLVRSMSLNSLPEHPALNPAVMKIELTGSFSTTSLEASVKSVSRCSTAGTINTALTTADTWTRTHSSYHGGGGGSDTGSLSGESQTSQRNTEQEAASVKSVSTCSTAGTINTALTTADTSTRTHSRYHSGGGCSDTGSLSGESQTSHRKTEQEDLLQKKHEMLHQMIERQQEELQRVKEQLLLARLGLLQPIDVPNPYAPPDQNQQQTLAQIAYANAPQVLAGYAHHMALPLPSMPSYSVHLPHASHPLQISQPTQTLQLSDTHHPTQTLQLSHTPQPTQPLQLSQTPQPTQPAQLSHTAQPTKQLQLSHKTQPTQLLQLSHTAQSTQPLQLTHTLQPTQPLQLSHILRPTQPLQLSHTSQLMQPLLLSHTAQPTQPLQLSHTPHLTQTLDLSQTPHPMQPLHQLHSPHPLQTLHLSESPHSLQTLHLLDTPHSWQSSHTLHTPHPLHSSLPLETLHLSNTPHPSQSLLPSPTPHSPQTPNLSHTPHPSYTLHLPQILLSSHIPQPSYTPHTPQTPHSSHTAHPTHTPHPPQTPHPSHISHPPQNPNPPQTAHPSQTPPPSQIPHSSPTHAPETSHPSHTPHLFTPYVAHSQHSQHSTRPSHSPEPVRPQHQAHSLNPPEPPHPSQPSE